MSEDDVLAGGPPLGMQRWAGLCTRDQPQVGRRAALAILVGWVPLAGLAAIDGLLLGSDAGKSFFTDYAATARSLVAVPLLILAESDCCPRLGRVVSHFLHAGFLTDHDRERFSRTVASTRRRLDSPAAEWLTLLLAYAVVVALMGSVPLAEFPAWHRARSDSFALLSLAGWWHAGVSVPILLVLVFGWLWRVLLWAWLLGRVASLELRLVPGHPDRAGGLRFVSTSLRGFRLPSFALGAVAAGMIANRVVHHDASPLDYKNIVIGVTVTAVVLFAGPPVVFMKRLRAAKWRGMLEYGALAGSLGQAFEEKWLKHRLDDAALDVNDFSATVDLFDVVANVYEMRDVPFGLWDLGLLAGAALAPFLPLVLLVVPIQDMVGAAAKLLL